VSNPSSHSSVPADAADKALALEQAFAEAQFPVALWSSAVLRFRWLNRACAVLTDGDPASWDVLGMPYRGFLSEASCASHLIDVAYTGQPSADPWYARGTGSDERVWRLTYLPVPAHLGDPADVLLTAVEITQSARAELSERRKRDDLYAASSLINATILSSLDAEEILERVLAESTEALEADWGWLAERSSGSWVFRAVHGWPVDMVGTAFRDDEISLPGLAARQHTVVHASIGGCSAEHRALMERHGIGAFALVPVQNRGEVTAVLGFCWDGTYAFGDAARALTRSLAVSLPLALENARLYEEEQSLTRSLRSALLPDPAGVAGFEVGHLYHAVSRTAPIGGGFYDLVPLAGGRAGVIMGDVRGSGPEIAALTSAVRSTMRSAVHRLPAPASVLARTNEFACTVSDRGLATTAFMGLISPDGRLEYSVAGHPPPVVLRSSGSLEQLLGDSAGLGSRASAGFTVRENRLGHGDLMVLYTEGLTGVSDRQGRRFGTEGLLDAVRACAGMAVRDVPESLFMSAFSHAEGRIDNEIAILALRRCAAA
jgi:serine phosphatase RsbU (regulator of sigma subunit)